MEKYAHIFTWDKQKKTQVTKIFIFGNTRTI